MNVEQNQDESENFVCESEDTIEVEAPTQEVEAKEEPASSETTNTEVDASKEVEANAEADNESTDKEEADSSGDDTTAETKAPKKRDGFQKSIDRVTRQRENEKRKNESLEARIKELEGNKQSDTVINKEPAEDDFETYDAYLDALDKFDKQPDQESAKDNATDKKDNESNSNEGLTDSQKTAQALLQDKLADAELPSDFDSIALKPELAITAEMVEALAECDNPAKVMLHLGNNESFTAELAGKSASQQARAIAKIDMSAPSKPNKPTKITQAPEAISPVNGTDSQQKSDSEMSFSEFEAKENAKTAQRKSTW